MQRHLGRLSLHHCRLWQHGEWLCLCHWLDWRFRLSGCIHASPKAQDWWSCGRLPSSRFLRSLGNYRSRAIWLGKGLWPLPWLEWIWLHGEWRWILPEWHWWQCNCSPSDHGLSDRGLVRFFRSIGLFRAEEDWFAPIQWPCGRGRHRFSSSLSTKGLCFGSRLSFTIQSLLDDDVGKHISRMRRRLFRNALEKWSFLWKEGLQCVTSHCTECSFCSFPYRTIVANFTINSSQLHLAIWESRVIFGEFFLSRRGSEVLWPRRKNAATLRYVSVLQATSKVSALYDVDTIPSNAFSGFGRKNSRVRVQWWVASFFKIYRSFTSYTQNEFHCFILFTNFHCHMPTWRNTRLQSSSVLGSRLGR